jgi:hypothetical protein
LGRFERDVSEVRRDLTEIRSDIALLENKTLSAQTEIVSILHRPEQAATLSSEHSKSLRRPLVEPREDLKRRGRL